MKFVCETCGYETHAKNCFDKHLESKRHREKSNSQAVKIRSSLVVNSDMKSKHRCQFCGNTFYNAGSLSRHKATCSGKSELEQEINNLKLEINHLQNINATNQKHFVDEIEQRDNQIEILKKENDYLKTIINNAGNIIKSSVSTISYVSQHYSDAPALEPLDDYSKLTYDIDSESNKTDNSQPRAKTDKEIRKDKDKFIYTIVDKDELDMRDYEPKLKRMNKLGEIMATIDNGTLAENIVGYVAPDFYLNKDNNVPKLKE